MKNICLTGLLLVFSISLALAQGGREEMSEKMEAQKIAFITTKLDLTTKQAQEFWPIYNEFMNEQKSLKEEQGMKKPDLLSMTDAEASSHYKKMLDMEFERLELKRVYSDQMAEVIGPKKLIVLLQLEDQFKKEVIERFRSRMRGQKGAQNKPRGQRGGQ